MQPRLSYARMEISLSGSQGWKYEKLRVRKKHPPAKVSAASSTRSRDDRRIA